MVGIMGKRNRFLEGAARGTREARGGMAESKKPLQSNAMLLKRQAASLQSH